MRAVMRLRRAAPAYFYCVSLGSIEAILLAALIPVAPEKPGSDDNAGLDSRCHDGRYRRLRRAMFFTAKVNIASLAQHKQRKPREHNKSHHNFPHLLSPK